MSLNVYLITLMTKNIFNYRNDNKLLTFSENISVMFPKKVSIDLDKRSENPEPPPNHHSPTRPEVNLFSSAVNETSKKRASPIAGSAPAKSLSVLKLISPSKTSSPNPPLPIIAVSIAILLARMAANFIPANIGG